MPLSAFLSASVRLEFVPVAGGDDGSRVENGLGSDERPPHALVVGIVLHPNHGYEAAFCLRQFFRPPNFTRANLRKFGDTRSGVRVA